MMPRAPVVLSLLAGLWCLPTLNGFVAWRRAQTSLVGLTRLNQDMTAQIETLKRDIMAMRHNVTYQEHVVRDELGYVKKGEMVFVLPIMPK